MKKLFLFVSAIGIMTTLNSCSGDDDSNSNPGQNTGGSISVKINGVSKTFNNVVVDKDTFVEDGETITELGITGTIGNSATEVIMFGVEMGDVGADATFSFRYLNGTNQYFDNGELSSVVQTNSNNKLKGNFSGRLSGSGNTVDLTEGSYDISH
ncbi:hypothetical protein GV828_06790 [Flavobacterium sp. NST-5]|uniref:Lipoprotein n=1 Tax=Flavobacterium ichthyis TaxID=2698827 RepID=A0ABW9Z8G2_9FLAO|nr:hypothetical protein [Flavobacterium ichthyis]NBL64904.1 hypothetical protein [Flavobacterium ichthyis]